MESNISVEEIVKAIREGRLTLKEVENALTSDDIPLDVLGTFHLLFCNKSHIPGDCTFYEEESRLSKGNCQAYMKWTRLTKLYIETFNSSTEGLREELSRLREVLRAAGKPSGGGIIALYFMLFYIRECDTDIMSFVTHFVQLLNEAPINKCLCYRKPGEVVIIKDPLSPKCSYCGLPLV